MEKGNTDKAQAAKNFARLTPRERDILFMIVAGMSAREAGTLLDISAKTVETHRARIMRKLSLPNAVELTRWAIRHKFISP